jgi:protein involved in polysaccharide export with SLBB domain
MTNRFVPSFVLLFMAAATVLYPQGTTDTGTGQSQQGLPAGCTDELSLAGEDCSQVQQRIPQAAHDQENGIPLPANLGPVLPESTTSGGQALYRERLLEQQQRQFPPELPTEFQKFVAETTGQFLQIYGENLFRHVPSTFAPSDQGPIPPDYVVGPDDELRVRVWGQINFSGNLRVDRSGDIYLPQIGPVPVAGLQFAAVDQHLRAAIAKLYRNFDLSVDIGRIRSIQVYVSGQARRPGAYTISSLSSLVDAIFATGGPSPEGSLRHILLKRGGKIVADFDLYDLLIHGDKSQDVRLLPEDVLYIPPVGHEVAITGSIKSPAIYELRDGETIGDLIKMAGQTTAVASSSRIALDRVEHNQSRNTTEVDFNAAGLATVLADGDILRIDPILPAYDRTVTLRGNVANPGRFSWHPGMRLSDLIPDRDSLVSRNYWWKRSHLGLPTPEFEPAISTLGENSRQPAFGGNRQSLGANSPGLTASEMQATVTDALKPEQPAGENYSSSSDAQNRAQNQYQNQNQNQYQYPNQNQYQYQPQRGSNASVASELAQAPHDDSSRIMQKNRVSLPDLQIDWDYAVIERIDPQSLKPSLIPFDLGKLVIEHDPSANLTLEPGDTVTIFSQSDIRVPIDQQVKYVDLEGEVAHAGFYSIQPGETLRDVVRRAGGLTPRAYLYGSELTRVSARLLQQQRLDDYVRSWTLEAERGTQALAISSSTSADVAASRTVTQDMISRLSQIKATGRIVLQFSPNSSGIDDIPAISLENGDKFVVPFAPGNVNVIGAVYDQNSYLYQPGKALGYYLQLAGGTNRNADWRHAFLIRADGSVASRTHIKGSGFWKESFNNIKLNPGDTIVVPDKTLRPTALRGFIEWSQVFSQLALGAAAINVL